MKFFYYICQMQLGIVIAENIQGGLVQNPFNPRQVSAIPTESLGFFNF